MGRDLALGQDGTLYQKGFGVLRAFDAAGKRLWSSPDGIWIDSAPVIGQDGTIYVREATTRFTDIIGGTNSGLLALRPDGSVKWRFPMKGIATSPFDIAFALDRRDTVYFKVAAGFSSPKTLFAVSKDGRELWHFDSTNTHLSPLEISSDGSILFESSAGTNTQLCRFDRSGSDGTPRTVSSWPDDNRTDLSFSMDWDGNVYHPGETGATLTALNPDGAVRWRFISPFHASSAPTIGPDGSLFFTASAGPGDRFLVAVTKNGEKKWQSPLGPHWSFAPPAVASDGTLFVVSSDPKVTALNPDGTVRWVFKPHRPLSKRRFGNWREFKRLLSEDFGSGLNVSVAPPLLTTNGTLYVCFGSPYDAIYALSVGVGLATNSPWPLQAGDPRLTRQVANQPTSFHH